MAATFDVSPVAPGVNPLPVQPFAAELERRVGSTLEACGGRVSTLVSGQRDHGFLAAVRLAFDQHYPLALRPQIGWAVRPARRAGPQLPIDAETGRPIHHVAFLAPASRLGRIFDEMRVATKAEAGPAWSFRFATASALVQVWRGAPPGELVPSAVVLVLPNVVEEWGDHQAASAVERRLLAAGAMHSVPIHALVAPFSGESSEDLLAAWLGAFPPPVTALFGRDGVACDVSELAETLTSLAK